MWPNKTHDTPHGHEDRDELLDTLHAVIACLRFDLWFYRIVAALGWSIAIAAIHAAR